MSSPPSQLQPFPAISSHFQSFPVISSHSRNVQPFSAISSHLRTIIVQVQSVKQCNSNNLLVIQYINVSRLQWPAGWARSPLPVVTFTFICIQWRNIHRDVCPVKRPSEKTAGLGCSPASPCSVSLQGLASFCFLVFFTLRNLSSLYIIFYYHDPSESVMFSSMVLSLLLLVFHVIQSQGSTPKSCYICVRIGMNKILIFKFIIFL